MNEGQRQETLLSEKKAASWLGISQPTLLRLRRKGDISYFQIGSRILYSEENLREYLSAVLRQRKTPKAEGE